MATKIRYITFILFIFFSLFSTPPASCAGPLKEILKPIESICKFFSKSSKEASALSQKSIKEGSTASEKLAKETASISEFENRIIKKSKKKNVNGKDVYQRDEIIDKSKTDGKGRTNCQRMLDGLAPLGPDDAEIELHHHMQNESGPIVELTKPEHKENSSDLHGYKSESEINRKEFDRWRKDYWKERGKSLCP